MARNKIPSIAHSTALESRHNEVDKVGLKESRYEERRTFQTIKVLIKRDLWEIPHSDI